MKKTVKIFGVAAIAAMALASCQKEAIVPVNDIKTVQMTIHGVADDMTKTVLQEDGTVLWGEGEKLGVFETIGETTNFYTSEEGVSADGGKTMSFPVTVTESDAAAFTYNAFYPVSALVGGDTDVTKVRTIFPSTQKPTATSFDAAADFLLAQPKEVTEQAAELKLSFKRVIGIAKMTLKNFPTDANVKEVAFTANAAEGEAAPILAGRIRLNMTAGTVEYGYDSPSNTISLDYAGQTIAADGMTVFFASCPFELGEGDSFQVAVTTDENITYTQKVTLTADQTLAVKPGRASVFSVNMKGAEEEEVESLEGDYIIVGKTSTDWRAATVTGWNSFIPVIETNVTKDLESINLTDSSVDFPMVKDVWTVEKCGDNYAIKSAEGKYIGWASGNSATAVNEAYELKISQKDNDSYDIMSVADNTRKLRFNSSSPRFAFYTSTQTDVFLIPFVKSTKPVITPAEVEVEVEAAGNEDLIIKLVCENLTDAPSAVSNVDWIEIDDIVEDQLDLVIAANTGEDRTGTVTLSATGADDVVITVKQKGTVDYLTIPYSYNFKNNGQGDFVIDDVSLAEGLSYVWSYDNRYGMKASAYVSNTCHASESWIISPKFKLDADATLTFKHALNKFKAVSNFSTEATLWIKEDGGSWEQLTLTYPESQSWNFVSSGEISLAAYTGKTVIFGFKYVSTTESAGTWEIEDFNITK